MQNNYQDMLANSLLRVRFQFHRWSAFIWDAEEAATLDTLRGSASGSHKVKKQLCKPEMLPIKRGGSHLRTFLYSISYPIGICSGIHKDTGRLIPSLVFDEHKTKLQSMIQELSDNIVKLCEENYFTTMIERDMKRLGNASHRGDYPATVADMQSKFLLDFKVAKFSVGQTMLFDIMDNAINDVEKASEIRAKEVIESMVIDLFKRIKEPLISLSNGMDSHGKSGKYFKKPTVYAIDEMIASVKSLNFANDSRISGILAEVKNKLDGIDPDALRESESDRRNVSKASKDIVAKIDAYL